LSPEEGAFSGPRHCRPQRRSGAAWRNNANALRKKSLKGWSPEKMLPLTLGNRDEDNMRAAD